jgi:hypothetical protein
VLRRFRSRGARSLAANWDLKGRTRQTIGGGVDRGESMKRHYGFQELG